MCVSKLTNIGSDNGLSPGRRQAIISTNAGILLIGPLGTNFSENSIGIQTFSFRKMPLKMSSAKWRPFCLGLNVLTHLHLGKMAAISQTIFSDAFSRLKVLCWCRTGAKPLSERMLTRSNQWGIYISLSPMKGLDRIKLSRTLAYNTTYLFDDEQITTYLSNLVNNFVVLSIKCVTFSLHDILQMWYNI